MRNYIKNNLVKALLILFVLIFLGCDDYFTNPLKDKETGEDINLLILDFNFFKTRMTYNLKDAKTGELISKEAVLKFSGKNSSDIVDYAGEKSTSFITTQGQIELTADPNVAISSSNPFEFVVKVEISGYNTLVKPISIQGEGVKTIELQLSKIADEKANDLTGNTQNGIDSVFHFSIQPTGVKSASTAAYQINYTLTMSNILKFKDEWGNYLFANEAEVKIAYKANPTNFLKVAISTYNEYLSGIEMVNYNGAIKSVLFQKLETGKMTSMTIAGKKVASFNEGVLKGKVIDPKDFLPREMGFVNFDDDAWKLLGDSVTHESIDFEYTLATVSLDDLCSQGSQINLKSSMVSSFSIVADVYNVNNQFITTVFLKGNFPQTFMLENMPSEAGKLVFRNSNPAFKPIATLNVNSLCSGSYDVNVELVAGYEQYQIVLKALCPKNLMVAIAPTYSAEVRLKNSDELWQGIQMKGGVIDLPGKPDNDYEIRLLWKDKWEYSTYSTKFDADGNYLGIPETDATIVSKRLADGRIQLSVEKIFEQNICDDLGW